MKPLLHNHLLNQHFADFAALTADIDAVLGISHAYTLEVIVFNRSILVNSDILNACNNRIIYIDRININSTRIINSILNLIGSSTLV